jgi:SAM-dependent methyltransferase
MPAGVPDPSPSSITGPRAALTRSRRIVVPRSRTAIVRPFAPPIMKVPLLAEDQPHRFIADVCAISDRTKRVAGARTIPGSSNVHTSGRSLLKARRLGAVLDAGCRSGRLTALLLERLPRGRVTAVDKSDAMLARRG